MKKSLIIIVAALILTTVSGCFPTDRKKADLSKSQTETSQQSSGVNEDKTMEIPELFNKKITDKLEFDAIVDVTKINSLKKSEAELREFDAQKIKEIFFQESENIEENTHGDGIGTTTTLIDNDNNSVYINNGGIVYRTNEYKIKPYSVMLYGNLQYADIEAMKKIYTKKEIGELSREKAIQDVGDKLNRLGIKQISEPDVIVLDFETLSDQLIEMGIRESKKHENAAAFEKGDEGYFISYTGKFADVNITDTAYISEVDGLECTGTRVYAIVTANGIVELNCQGIYNFEESAAQDIPGVITFDQAVSAVENKFKDIILDSKITINQIKVNYIPVATEDGEYMLAPYWIFTADEKVISNDIKGESEHTNTFYIYISCETGEELITM